jgi:hypothetical protein
VDLRRMMLLRAREQHRTLGRWHHRLGFGKMAARRGARPWRLRGGLDDSAEAPGQLDDGAEPPRRT